MWLLFRKPVGADCDVLGQWFSTFLVLQPLTHTVPHVVVNTNHKIISLLAHN